MRSQFSNDEFAPPEEDDIATRKNRPYHFELEPGQRRHWRDYFAPAFTADQRADTTIWMAGLTTNHDSFVCAAARGLGYKMETLPQPDNTTLTIGKEFGITRERVRQIETQALNKLRAITKRKKIDLEGML